MWFERRSGIANRLASDFNTSINPGIRKGTITKDYDLFFAVVQFPKDLLTIRYLKGWKSRCRVSVCWLNEIWIPDIAKTMYHLETLSNFDYVVLHWSGSVQPVQQIIRKPCFYAPYGIDAASFCPYPQPAQRVVDVYSIGRRSTVTHRALLKMALEKRIFYVYDTVSGVHVSNAQEHRALLANMGKRSRYFIVNPGKADNPLETGGQVEFGNRFFEGAASGTIMIGERPTNAQFEKVFDWPDAVVHLPFDSDEIGRVIAELDRDTARQETIRRTNVTQSLLRHDWVYRWEQILSIAGLAPLPALQERKKVLAELASRVNATAPLV
jgi:spore maturation protein CgeB